MRCIGYPALLWFRSQVTFQAKNIAESRHLFDQLSVLSPVMVGTVSCSPFWLRFLIVSCTMSTDGINCSVPCVPRPLG
jgi:hypothetical protein